MGYVYIFLTIVLSSYGQLILKWRMNSFGDYPDEWIPKLTLIMKSLLDPYIISSFLAAFLASLTWMAALTKFELSTAYPYMSLSFVVVFIVSYLLLGESVSVYKVGGTLLIVAGVILLSKG